MNNLKLLLLLGAFLGFNNIVLSQKDILLDKKVTWIKSKKLKDSIVIEDKSSLNFNIPINKNDFLVEDLLIRDDMILNNAEFKLIESLKYNESIVEVIEITKSDLE